MKLKTLLLTLLAATLLGGCVKSPVPDTPNLLMSLPVAGKEAVWDSSSHMGKPVLVAFMASFCGWCKKSLPALEQINKEFGDQVEVVGVFVDEDEEAVKKIIQQYNLNSTILYNGRGAAYDLGVQGFPNIILFNQKHKIEMIWSGYSDTLAHQYRTEINKLLK